jgi:hypothetical protein
MIIEVPFNSRKMNPAATLPQFEQVQLARLALAHRPPITTVENPAWRLLSSGPNGIPTWCQ